MNNMYYSADIKGTTINSITKEEVMKLKGHSSMVCKYYYPIKKGVTSKNMTNIILYTSDFPNETADKYIGHFTFFRQQYGDNAINQDDIELCKYFNDK